MAKMQKAIIYKGPGKFAYEERPIPEIKDKNDVKNQELWMLYLWYGCQYFCNSAETSV